MSSLLLSTFLGTFYAGTVSLRNLPLEHRNTDPSRPLSLFVLTISSFISMLTAIVIDTTFFNPSLQTFRAQITNPTITPFNSLLYNAESSNLALHGLHPRYQHLVASLPLLLGPSLYLLVSSARWGSAQISLVSAFSSILFLSCIAHQEPRFLLPAVPLILSSVQMPSSKFRTRYWLASWVVFNAAMGVLMGMYHQGGVIPAQLWLGQEKTLTADLGEVFWWRTYSPPIWLLDHNPLKTTDLMGIPFLEMQTKVKASLGPDCDPSRSVGLVAPHSSVELDSLLTGENGDIVVESIWRYSQHLNLDDLDIAEEGILGTWKRVTGRRGLVISRVRRKC